ncbi:hypothetical protein [Armatimonas rosea]|uniref:Uncharacterized protein n=1 Tax=Armatimonas rosea TaxID=685828 RepID=A0A7W9W7R2_ARMRO|nr:hypothetical protein [Armatimonas rosea]MBB6051360.1 hypothetical protein [Armatimonas rosea]
MTIRSQRRLGMLAIFNGAALLIASRLLPLDDPFGDRARIFQISGTALTLIGLVALLGIAEWGKGMEPKWSGVLRISLGLCLALFGTFLNLSSFSKSWGFLSIPLTLVATILLTIGWCRR